MPSARRQTTSNQQRCTNHPNPPHARTARRPRHRRRYRGSTASRITGLNPLLLHRCETDGVPTEIYFAAENVWVMVDEDAIQVAEALTSANGLPFRLTRLGDRGEVYINPATVAFWSASESGSEPAPPQESPESTTEPYVPVNIWGKPLRRKPRR